MNKKLIIIAEDEEAYGRILKDFLEKEGYIVLVTDNGDDLLQFARKEKVSLILLDMIMPKRNGFQVLAEMKNDLHLKKIPIIALSNAGQKESIEKAKKLGVDDYIIKSDESFYTIIDKIKVQLN